MARSKAVLLAGLSFLAAWHLALRWRAFDLPLLFDEGDYAYVARVWSRGGLPYRDVFDQKPPNVHLFYRAAAAAHASEKSPRYLAAGFSLATMALLFFCVPESWPVWARLAAPGFYAGLSAEPVGDLGFAANTEVFLCLFTALAALLWLRGKNSSLWIFACGLACGAAVMTKQTSVWTAAAFLGLWLWSAPRLRTVGSFTAGAVVVPVAWALYFLARGGFAPFWRDAFGGNLAYAGLVAGPRQWAAQATWFFSGPGADFAKGDWPLYVLAALGLRGLTPTKETRLETAAVLWLGTALCGALTGLFLFPHYFLAAYPALALAAAAGVKRLHPRWAPVALAFALLYPAALRVRPLFLDAPEVTARKLLYPNPLYESRRVADFARARTTPDEPIYVYGSETQIYYYADRRCATRYSYVYPLTLFPRERAQIEGELSDLARARPKIIVYSAQPLSTMIASPLGLEFREGVRALLRKDYRPVARADMKPEGYGWTETPGPVFDFSPRDSLLVFERRD